MDRRHILQTLSTLLVQMRGHVWTEGSLDPECLVQDLELESLEFVVIAEQLQATYPGRCVVEALARCTLDQLRSMRIGALVEIVATSTARTDLTAGPAAFLDAN